MSHHGNNQPKELAQAMHEMMQTCFGEFPDGKSEADDQGAIAVGFSSEPGIVKMHFPKPVLWIGFTPDQAIAMAESLIQHARAANKGGTRILTVKL